jgi:RimJ/RimL family protein N-acetyltransferase|eukprot:Stramenopile-MAST_4_protein_2554
MRKNWHLKIVGEKVVLVPYRRKYVAGYHAWMQDEYLQQMTASEPLSLEEEYSMQASWRDDETKCTFIVLDRTDGDKPVGDVNLYYHDSDEPTVGEIEVMIAEPSGRRKGLATEALHLFMHYAIDELGTTRFVAKISDVNKPSLALFTALGYQIYAKVECFEETHMEMKVGPAAELNRVSIRNCALGAGYKMVGDLPQEACDQI